MGLAWLASELQGSPSLCLPRDEIRDLCLAGSQGSELKPICLHSKRFMNSPITPAHFSSEKFPLESVMTLVPTAFLFRLVWDQRKKGAEEQWLAELCPQLLQDIRKDKDSVSLGGSGLALPSDTS